MAAAIGKLTNGRTGQIPWADLLAVRLPLALLLALPLLAPQLLPNSRLLSLAVTAAIYVVVANGLHIIFSYTGQLSLAHTALWGLGAYTGALILENYGWTTWQLLPVAGLMAAAAAVAIGIPAFRTAGFSFAIVTFAFAEIMRLIALNWSSLTHGSTGVSINEPVTPIGSIEFDTIGHLENFYYLVLAFAYVSIIGVFFIRQSNLGRTFIAIRENEALAKSVGINIYLNKLISFALSGLFAGVAGVLIMYQRQHIEAGPLSDFSAFFTIQFLLAILVGGRDSMLGPALGCVVIVFGPELVNAIFGDVMTHTRIQILFGCTLALSVITAPNGIAGQAKQRYHQIGLLLRRSQGPVAVPAGADAAGAARQEAE
jgi:branched-chain amino acid transport system permease protein